MKHLDRLTIFTFLWAWQSLTQHLRYNGLRTWFYEDDWLGWLRLALILPVLFVPRSVPLFLAMVGVSVAHALVEMPIRSVHITLELMMNLILLLGFTLSAVQRRKQPGGLADADTREAAFDDVAPFARATLIVFYFFVVLHKLNHDFLDHTVSCVSTLYLKVANRLAFLPTAPWALNLAIVGTLAAELALPVLLCFRRTWKIAIFIGVPFHILLALPLEVGIKGFTTLIFVLYFLFTERDFAQRIGELGSSVARRLHLAGKAVWMRLAFLGFVLLIVLSLLYFVHRSTHWYEIVFEDIFWMPSIAVLIVIALKCLPRSSNAPAAGVARCRWRWVIAAVPLLAIFIGLNPYLGLRTEASWAMFSNLRTEGPYNNHYFMPRVKLASFQDDLVETISHTRGGKDVTALYTDTLIPYHQFQAELVNSRGDFDITYLRGGQTYTVSRTDGVLAGDTEIFTNQPPWLQRKLLIFRRIDKGEKNRCNH